MTRGFAVAGGWAGDGQQEAAAALARARGRADEARMMAARDGEAASRAEQCARQAPAVMSENWARVAAIHRRSQQRHLAAAQLNAAFAARLQQSMGQRGTCRAAEFVAAAASVSGCSRVVFTVSGREQTEALVAASDNVARAACDLERAHREGPATDAVARRAVVQRSGNLATVWPQYGPAVNRLGIHAVSAAPLWLDDHCFGSVTALDAHPDGPGPGLGAGQLADALVWTLLARDVPADGEGLPALPLFDADQAVIHQGAGMVAAQSGLDIADALALLRARAFADNQPVAVIAARIVSCQLQLAALD